MAGQGQGSKYKRLATDGNSQTTKRHYRCDSMSQRSSAHAPPWMARQGQGSKDERLAREGNTTAAKWHPVDPAISPVGLKPDLQS